MVKAVKSTSKTRLDHLFLSVTSNDKYLRSQLDFLHLSIQHNNKRTSRKEIQFNQGFPTYLDLWPTKLWF